VENKYIFNKNSCKIAFTDDFDNPNAWQQEYL